MLRYLRDKDYKKIIQEEYLDRLTDDSQDTLMYAEDDAMTLITSYLINKFNIEKEFEIGSNILDFDPQIESFRDDMLWIGDVIHKVNGYKNPSRPPLIETYWSEIEHVSYDPEENYVVGDIVSHKDCLYELRFEGYEPNNMKEPSTTYFMLVDLTPYTQTSDYEMGEIVSHRGMYFVCNIDNGPMLNNICQPISKVFELVDLLDYPDVTPIAFVQDKYYRKDEIVSYNGNYYLILSDIMPEDGSCFYPGYGKLWDEILFEEWDDEKDYSIFDINTILVSFESKYYLLTDISSIVVGEEPSDVSWTEVLTPEYSRSDRYVRSDTFGGVVEHESSYFYLKEENEVFVNPTTVESDPTEFSIVRKDPRNRNIVTALTKIVIFDLYSKFSPDNVPMSRDNAYVATIDWLKSAQKMAVNTGLDKKSIISVSYDKATGEQILSEKKSSNWVVADRPSENNWIY